MSRIGKQPIAIPAGVNVNVNDSGEVSIKGKNGELKRIIHPSMSAKLEENFLKVVPKSSKPGEDKNFFGLTRTLLSNMVVGVTEGFSKKLTLVGVGYRAAVQGGDLNLTLGFSHPVVYKIPKGISIKVEKQTGIVVEGADKEQVGQVAADIRSYRKPEPYHGKGVRYADERIITKAGKASGKK